MHNSGDILHKIASNDFTNVQEFYCYYYWFSTADAISKDMGIFVDMGYGAVYYSDKSLSYYVWPVRAGKYAGFVSQYFRFILWIGGFGVEQC